MEFPQVIFSFALILFFALAQKGDCTRDTNEDNEDEGFPMVDSTSTLSTTTAKENLKFADLASYLKYGDPCSMEDEEYRKNISRTILNLPGDDRFLRLVILNKFMEDVEAAQTKFCSSLELLVCDKESSTCVCGGGSDGDNRTNFVTEMDQEDGKLHCRWAPGAACMSDDLFKAMGMPANFKCGEGTACISKRNANPYSTSPSICTFDTIVNYIRDKYGRAKKRGVASSIKKLVVKDLRAGKICTCQQSHKYSKAQKDDEFTITNNSNEDDDNDKNKLRLRRKRSISEEHQKIMGMVDPILNHF